MIYLSYVFIDLNCFSQVMWPMGLYFFCVFPIFEAGGYLIKPLYKKNVVDQALLLIHISFTCNRFQWNSSKAIQIQLHIWLWKIIVCHESHKGLTHKTLVDSLLSVSLSGLESEDCSTSFVFEDVLTSMLSCNCSISFSESGSLHRAHVSFSSGAVEVWFTECLLKKFGYCVYFTTVIYFYLFPVVFWLWDIAHGANFDAFGIPQQMSALTQFET